ncbi:hypothetical protein EJ05DRAFT_503175 [Pseudovirgaria hyperparasitica]|uniref:Class E vacuolar protein-sorting machinery protein HSE1 n=1 Tax=Pseudovirgaria hyperparasitica TaxID=470096 RepID=A0A6A6W3U8_9PEZI|nr:uncharacterized protein EJ05DRAFT_503175 [Pseudovirgaria hyperparasitica]KAF2755721.1 hypothetical protein EJ05DRAFT_503175 [Pseudovirgaria hyperparasitica]
MFRAQQNAFDDAVAKATDENLTSENWEFILDVCDKVGSDEAGAKNAVAAMIKRLAHRNANVQLYTLELANALSQNCGNKMHRELASRSFTDAMIRLAGDRNTHQQVKTKILERMAEWTEMFKKDPDLGIMEQAYMRLKTQNPELRPPSKPQKTQISESDRQKEEEELQMALALSVKDSAAAASKAGTKPSPAQTTSTSAPTETPSQPVPSGTTAATVSRVRALFDFQPSEPGELQFRKGDVIAVLESVYKDWWKGSLRGQSGIFPLNYVEKLQDPTQEELQREAQMEGEVFAQIRNVEKLLALLSTSSRAEGDVRDNEEITELYHSTLAIRPKLIELIGKYSQKKDDFTQLNEKFIKARRDYESLLEASMSHPPQPTYSHTQRPYSYAPPSQQNYPQYGPGAPGPQRFYSPAPPENSYPPQNGPAPFMMVPPGQQPQQRPSQSPKPAPAHMYPPPNALPGASGGPPPQQHHQAPPPQGPQSQRLNSGPPGGQRPHSMAFPPGGVPQELSTGQFDSPVENRPGGAYPPPSHAPPGPPQAPYENYGQPPPPQQQQPHRQASYDSPTSMYSQATFVQPSAPSQPNHPPPAIPGSPNLPPAGTGAYQAYQPPPQTAQGGHWAGGDEGFYR